MAIYVLASTLSSHSQKTHRSSAYRAGHRIFCISPPITGWTRLIDLFDTSTVDLFDTSTIDTVYDRLKWKSLIAYPKAKILSQQGRRKAPMLDWEAEWGVYLDDDR